MNVFRVLQSLQVPDFLDHHHHQVMAQINKIETIATTCVMSRETAGALIAVANALRATREALSCAAGELEQMVDDPHPNFIPHLFDKDGVLFYIRDESEDSEDEGHEWPADDTAMTQQIQ